MKQALLILGIALLTYISLQVVKDSAPSAARGAPVGIRALQVETRSIESVNVPVVVASFGTVEPAERFRIHPLVAGQVISKSDAFKDGNRVRKDTILLQLDRSKFQVALASARADYAAAVLALADERARADQAKSDWAKRGPDGKAKDYVLRKPHLIAAEARLESAKTTVEIARQDLERTTVKAGFDGIIRSVSVEQGAFVNTTQELGSGFSDLVAELRLPLKAADLLLLNGSKGASSDDSNIRIEVFNTLSRENELWAARFVRMESSIDPLSQQVTIVAHIEAPFSDSERTALLPGQYVKARIIGQELEGVVLVENELIYQDSYVYVVEGGGADEEPAQLVQRPVIILHRTADKSVIKSGLMPGDELVTTILGSLPSGTKVKVVKGAQ
jgi:RND family efflux transporter MFP subunit